jgi:hypothetical protein
VFEVLKIILVGVLNDALVFILASTFLALYFLFLSNSKYQKPYGQIILGILVFFPVHPSDSEQYFQTIRRLGCRNCSGFYRVKNYLLRINAFPSETTFENTECTLFHNAFSVRSTHRIQRSK